MAKIEKWGILEFLTFVGGQEGILNPFSIDNVRDHHRHYFPSLWPLDKIAEHTRAIEIFPSTITNYWSKALQINGSFMMLCSIRNLKLSSLGHFSEILILSWRCALRFLQAVNSNFLKSQMCIIPLISLCCYQHTCWTIVESDRRVVNRFTLMPFASKEDSIQFEGISIQVDKSILKIAWEL